jgi:hypothetical protein
MVLCEIYYVNSEELYIFYYMDMLEFQEMQSEIVFTNFYLTFSFWKSL